MKVKPVAGSTDREHRTSAHRLYVNGSSKKTKKISPLSNLLREATMSRMTLVAVISSILPIFMAGLIFEPQILFEGAEWSRVERIFLAVVVYRALFETSLCIIRCSYHKASGMNYLHDKRIQGSVEIVLYAAGFVTLKFTGLVDDNVPGVLLILLGTAIESIALACDAVHDDAEACLESPLVHLIILPITHSLMTFFFFFVLVFYLFLANERVIQDDDGDLTVDRYCNITISADDSTQDFSFSSAMSNFDFDLR